MNHRFAENLGSELHKNLPQKPGVYLFKDHEGHIIYIGKAKNLKKRLDQYRLAGRKKRQRKMRVIVSEARSIDFHICLTETEALLLENQLIQQYRPKFNIAGAYFFLYPYLALKFEPPHFLSIGYTTEYEALQDLGFQLYGAFRSRELVQQTYEALFQLFPYFAHRDVSKSRSYTKIDYTRIVVFRQLEESYYQQLNSFLRGETTEFMAELFQALLEKPGARHAAKDIQIHFKILKQFFRDEAHRLRRVLNHQGIEASSIAQQDRDPLFISFET
ncbi:MAG: GIY-YIG nuclease family protein [Oligoflexus sp.]